MRLEGKRALVTGAAAGLGRAIALAFAREGAALFLTDIDQDGLAVTVGEIEALAASATTFPADLADEAQLARLAEAYASHHSHLDCLVNNAGLHAGEIAQGFFGLGQGNWQRFFSVNTIAPLLLAEGLRGPLTAAQGLIVNISSMASYAPATAYGVTKGSLNLVTHALAMQLAADRVRAVAIAPGLMDTEAARAGVDAARWDQLQTMQAVGRQGTPEDIAALAVFLASAEGSFINDDVILCDGGNRLRGFRY